MLDQLQPDKEALWGGAEVQGSVLSCDFYNSGTTHPFQRSDQPSASHTDLRTYVGVYRLTVHHAG